MAPLIPPPPPPDSMIVTYMTLRKWIGVMGLCLVPVLILGSFLLDDTRVVKISVSAYYYSHMRNVLVGVLCGIGFFLLCYHGYSWKDSLASKLAGIFAFGIAFFPTSEETVKDDIISKIHYIDSAFFFVVLSYMSIFLFTKSAGTKTPQKKIRNRVYRTCGIVMLASVSCIPLDGIPAIRAIIPFPNPTLVFETIALTAFGLSWLTKGEFILKDKPQSRLSDIRSQRPMALNH